MNRTISFDWDNTLWNEGDSLSSSEGHFIPEQLALLGSFIRQGDRVIIVTARANKWIQEIHDALATVGLTLEVFSCPAQLGDETDTELTKSTILIREGASIHFDDIPDDGTLIFAAECGIEIKLPIHLEK